MSNADRACQLHREGFNCAQSVLMACHAEAGLSEETARDLGAYFGGGMRRGEVCGAISASLMLLGLEGDPKNTKAAGLMREFQRQFGSIRCRELLGEDGKKSKDFCRTLIRFCMEYLEKES